MKEVIILGYSGHAYVLCDIFLSMNWKVKAYCESEEKNQNPFKLAYWGHEDKEEVIQKMKGNNWFVGIGNNHIRKKLTLSLMEKLNSNPCKAIHQNASVSSTSTIGDGTMIGDGAIINACSKIGAGVICNTQVVVEHECTVGDFSHIAPGAVLCGNVTIGENSFIGARTVIKEGVKIGDNVTIGAGTVVISNIPSNSKIVGNPQRYLK